MLLSRVGRSHLILSADWIIDVSSQHSTIYLFFVNTLSQFMVEPRRVHWVAVKHVLCYLCGTVDFGLSYVQGDGVRLVGFNDSDWAGSVVDRKSTSRMLL
jgi:hypothetical protein